MDGISMDIKCMNMIKLHNLLTIAQCEGVNNGKESGNIKKNWATVIQSEEFNMKESWCYNVSVLMNHHQGLKRYYLVSLDQTLNIHGWSNDTR